VRFHVANDLGGCCHILLCKGLSAAKKVAGLLRCESLEKNCSADFTTSLLRPVTSFIRMPYSGRQKESIGNLGSIDLFSAERQIFGRSAI